MAAFFMVLIWAAAFGDTLVVLEEDNMIEEWIICIQIYIFIVVLQMFRKKVNKNND